jgi:hypothetical protein
MVVHPTDNDILYAVKYTTISRTDLEGKVYYPQVPSGIFRTKHGQYGKGGDADWDDVSPFAFNNSLDSATIDVSRSNPNIIYTALRYPPSQSTSNQAYLYIYRSSKDGDPGTWFFTFAHFDSGNDINYNPFIRVHPKYPYYVYYGGVYLHRLLVDPILGHLGLGTAKIPNVHDDQKELVFAEDGIHYYALTDGGIWIGNIDQNTGHDVVFSRNFNLRSHMFYDLDVSQTNPDVMIGGLQDNGTIKYQTNSSEWRQIRDGDGLYVLISPLNEQIMYSQNQFLHDTRRSDNEGDNWYQYNNDSIVGLVETENSGDLDTKFIVMDDAYPQHIMAQGPYTQNSWDSGKTWSPDKNLNYPLPFGQVFLKGEVTQFQFLDDSYNYLFGTSEGQVWHRTNTGGGGIRKISDVPNTRVDRVVRSPYDVRQQFVLSRGIASERVKRFIYDQFDTWTTQDMTGDLPTKHLIADSDLIINTIAADPCGSANVVYVGTDKGVFRVDLTESGFKWESYNVGLPLVNVMKLVPVMQTNELRAATYGRGVWKVKTTCNY